ncbi:MAG: PH domain-containing protein [Nocardioidaceae bacterium]
MPAGSDGPGPVDPTGSDRAAPPPNVALPHTYRPRGARIATAIAAATIVASVAFLWLMLSSDVRAEFSVAQRVTLLGFFVAVLVVLNGIFRTSARATDHGLTVVNGYRRHELEWGQLVRISLTPNRPWALLDLDDGTTLAVMAIQSADGKRATRSAREVARVIALRSRPDHDS